MHQAAADLQFEPAARLRDEVSDLKKELRGMREAGTAFLTRAFRAFGSLGPDNAVARITRFERCPGGSTGTTELPRTGADVGTQVPAEILLKGMIVQSGNDATIALAEKVGGTEDAFVEMMNTYAKQLGMKSSHFANSSGLPDPNLYTTAHDIATLARAVIREHPEFYKWYSMREFVWNGIKQQNRNGLLGLSLIHI